MVQEGREKKGGWEVSMMYDIHIRYGLRHMGAEVEGEKLIHMSEFI